MRVCVCAAVRVGVHVRRYSPHANTHTHMHTRTYNILLYTYIIYREYDYEDIYFKNHSDKANKSAVPRLTHHSGSAAPALRSMLSMKEGRSREPVRSGYMYSGHE